MGENSRTDDEHELAALKTELNTIEKWNALFGEKDRNEDSYVARERRRWEICLRIRDLSERLGTSSE
jgi:hypothetical protein